LLLVSVEKAVSRVLLINSYGDKRSFMGIDANDYVAAILSVMAHQVPIKSFLVRF
jgi:hypothetical protein